MGKFLADLFKTPGNHAWELARFLAAYAVASYSATFLVPLIRHDNPAFDYSSLGIGYAAILAGAGALIWAKDTARTAAAVAANPPPDPSKVEVINPPERPVQTEDAGR